MLLTELRQGSQVSQTFVIRVFDSADAPPGLRGVVRHVASGLERPFGRLDELAALLEAGTRQPVTGGPWAAGGAHDSTG